MKYNHTNTISFSCYEYAFRISRPMSYLNKSHIIGRCVGRPSADHRLKIGGSSLATYYRPMCRQTVIRRSADCNVLGLI